MKKPDTLIRTKLHLPTLRQGLVARPRLQERILKGLGGPLTLLAAPAGFGKTTLAAASISTCGMPIAWLSLDREDNQVERFLNYLVAALQDADNSIGETAAQFMAASPPAPTEAILTSLVNDLDRPGREMAMVLDDYQFISNPAVHAAVAFLLEHFPPALHLVIATRSDPPLPLARLRGRDQVVELRAADLRFSGPEAARFLNEVMGLHLEPAAVTALEERTEGWIAGLQMAALSMRNRQDIAGFIRGFSGTNRYILDYLLEEVLSGQPADVQRFLLCTSILERLTAALCEAVLSGTGGTESQGDEWATGSETRLGGRSGSILEYLERANLFLAPLDDERTWYRYHQLFTDLLQARLKEAQAGLIPQLHLRASRWFEQNGYIVEAIQHSLSTGDYERSAGLILKYGPAAWSQNEPGIIRLTGSLPVTWLKTHPKLGIYQAWILISGGQTQSAIPLLLSLKEHLDGDASHPDSSWIQAFIDLLLAYTTPPGEGTHPGPLPDLQAFSSMPEPDAGLHNIADFIYAMLLGRRGELDEPADLLLECIQRDTAARGKTAIPLVVPLLARIRLMQGRLHEAADLCRGTLRSINKSGTGPFYRSGSLNIILGEVLREWNDLDEAETQIREGIRVNEPWQMISADALGYGALARVQEARGDIEGATATLHKLETMFEDRTQPPDWEGEMRSLKVRLWLASGDLAGAVDWARHFPIQPYPTPIQETDLLTAARVRMAEKNYPEAGHILEALNQAPGIEKRTNRKIKINLLMACVLAAQNQMSQAFQLLESSLSLAEPEKLTRVFLDIGQPMQQLLAQWLAHASSGRGRNYGIHLLTQFAAEPNGIAATAAEVSPDGSLIEALTRRELDVLGLLAAGLSNRQIAEKLILSLGTVKFYVHAVMEKLGVHSRTQAILAAKEHNLL
jgi:LuxR family transcriptional regulator, maltose regulon positive regulatory protein